MSNLEAYYAKEQEYHNRALNLIGAQHPYFNLVPIIDLIKQADALGFDVVRRDAGLQQQQHD